MMRRIDQPFLDTDRYVRQQLGDETEAHARRAQRADRAARGGSGPLIVRANGVTLTGTVRVLDFLSAATIDGGIVTVPAGAGGAYTDEQVRDVMGVALVAGANVTITVNDAADTITIAATAGAGGGAPTTATYITQTADAGLSAEQALSSLATGILKVANGTGVLSTAVGVDLPAHTHTNDHVAATVADTASIDLTLTGQQVSAAAIFGTAAGTVAQGSDARLSDARTPTAHTHPQTDVTSLTTDLAAKAPVGAAYIVQTADATLTGEQALGSLATGILKSTTTTGVLSIAVGADLPAHTHANDHVAVTVINTATVDLTLTGQAVSAAVIDNTNIQKSRVSKAAVLIGTRREINLIEGAGTTLTVADNAVSDRVDVTIASSGAAAGFNETLQVNTWLKAATITTNTALTSGLTAFHYIGRAQAAVAAAAIVTGIYKVTVIAAGAITWAEVALFKGSPVAFGNASLTRLGFASIAGVVTVLGTKATAITLTTAIAAGDDLWLAIGGAAATTQFQIRGGLAEEIQFGVFQTATIRPSLASSPQATTLGGAAVVPGSVGIRF